MTAKEFYEKIGGSYDEIIRRCPKDEKLKKYARLFHEDPSIAELQNALDTDDVDTAFRAAHTLKGVCANLAYKKLQEFAIDITEDLRAKDMETAKKKMPQLLACYQNTIAVVDEFLAD